MRASIRASLLIALVSVSVVAVPLEVSALSSHDARASTSFVPHRAVASVEPPSEPLPGHPLTPRREHDVRADPRRHRKVDVNVSRRRSVLELDDFVVRPATDVNASFQLDLTFYKKFVDVRGIPVLSSAKVSDRAVQLAAVRVSAMTSDLSEELMYAMTSRKTRVAVMAGFDAFRRYQEITTDVPEHAHLDPSGFDKYRGLGAIPGAPVTTVGEENLICDPRDPYLGEDILTHEFAHAIEAYSYFVTGSTLQARIQASYNAAIAAGRWANTYAGSNWMEYWAEGSQTFLNSNFAIRKDCCAYGAMSNCNDGVNNCVQGREDLRQYDRTLHDIAAEIYNEDVVGFGCPGSPPVLNATTMSGAGGGSSLVFAGLAAAATFSLNWK